jgi:hypothetical protein
MLAPTELISVSLGKWKMQLAKNRIVEGRHRPQIKFEAAQAEDSSTS